jgi:hypothetical protein
MSGMVTALVVQDPAAAPIAGALPLTAYGCPIL